MLSVNSLVNRHSNHQRLRVRVGVRSRSICTYFAKAARSRFGIGPRALAQNPEANEDCVSASSHFQHSQIDETANVICLCKLPSNAFSRQISIVTTHAKHSKRQLWLFGTRRRTGTHASAAAMLINFPEV